MSIHFLSDVQVSGGCSANGSHLFNNSTVTFPPSGSGCCPVSQTVSPHVHFHHKASAQMGSTLSLTFWPSGLESMYSAKRIGSVRFNIVVCLPAFQGERGRRS